MYALQRELTWLLEDACGSEWTYDLNQSPDDAASDIRLRLPFSELQDLWARRINERQAPQTCALLEFFPLDSMPKYA